MRIIAGDGEIIIDAQALALLDGFFLAHILERRMDFDFLTIDADSGSESRQALECLYKSWKAPLKALSALSWAQHSALSLASVVMPVWIASQR